MGSKSLDAYFGLTYTPRVITKEDSEEKASPHKTFPAGSGGRGGITSGLRNFSSMLNEHLSSELLREELQRPNALMDLIRPDSSWVGGTLEVPMRPEVARPSLTTNRIPAEALDWLAARVAPTHLDDALRYVVQDAPPNPHVDADRVIEEYRNFDTRSGRHG